MSLRVETVTRATPALVNGLNALVPQLSTSAPRLTTSDVERLINSEAVTLFVARDDEDLVGALTLVVFSTPTGQRAWIEDVVVDEDARGLGIGAMLTNAAIARARQHAVRSVDLTSRPSRVAANALYQKLGFELRETNVYRFFLEDR